VRVIDSIGGKEKCFEEQADLLRRIAFEEDGVDYVEELYAHVEERLGVHATCLHNSSARKVTDKLVLLQLVHQYLSTLIEVFEDACEHLTAIVCHEVSTSRHNCTKRLYQLKRLHLQPRA